MVIHKGLLLLALFFGHSCPAWGGSQGSSLPGDKTHAALLAGFSGPHNVEPSLTAWLAGDPWVARAVPSSQRD